MAKGKKTGGGPLFQKGNPGGPGRPIIPEDEKELRKQLQKQQADARWDWQAALNKYRSISLKELRALSTDESLTGVELAVIRCRILVATKPRPKDIAALLKIECGADPKQIEVSGPGGEPIDLFANISSDRLAKAFAKLEVEEKCHSTTSQSQSSPSQAPLDLPSRPPGSRTES